MRGWRPDRFPRLIRSKHTRGCSPDPFPLSADVTRSGVIIPALWTPDLRHSLTVEVLWFCCTLRRRPVLGDLASARDPGRLNCPLPAARGGGRWCNIPDNRGCSPRVSAGSALCGYAFALAPCVSQPHLLRTNEPGLELLPPRPAFAAPASPPPSQLDHLVIPPFLAASVPPGCMPPPLPLIS